MAAISAGVMPQAIGVAMWVIVQCACGVRFSQVMVEGTEGWAFPFVGAVFELPACAALALSLPVDDAEWESFAGVGAEGSWAGLVVACEEPCFFDEERCEVFVVVGAELEA